MSTSGVTELISPWRGGTSASQGRKAELLQMTLSSWANSLVCLLTKYPPQRQESWAWQGVPSLPPAATAGRSSPLMLVHQTDWNEQIQFLSEKCPPCKTQKHQIPLLIVLVQEKRNKKLNYPSAPTNGTCTLKSRDRTRNCLCLCPFQNYPTWVISSCRAARPELNPNTLDCLQFFDFIYQYSLLAGVELYFKSIRICS